MQILYTYPLKYFSVHFLKLRPSFYVTAIAIPHWEKSTILPKWSPMWLLLLCKTAYKTPFLPYQESRSVFLPTIPQPRVTWFFPHWIINLLYHLHFFEIAVRSKGLIKFRLNIFNKKMLDVNSTMHHIYMRTWDCCISNTKFDHLAKEKSPYLLS